MENIYKNHFEKFPYGKSNSEPEFIKKLLDNFFPNKNNLTKLQEESFENIYKDLMILDTVLLPFREAGILYELGVTGGSIYDIVTGCSESTKDMDVVINFPSLQSFSSSINNEQIKYEIEGGKDIDFHNIFSKHFPKEKKISLYDNNDMFNLLHVLIKKELNISSSYGYQELEKGNYLSENIFNLIKINDSKLSKPMDLMFSNRSINEFVHSFDFYICRMWYQHNYVSELDRNKKGADFSIDNMLNNLYISTSALYDLKDKKITMNLMSFKEDNINYFMTNHYLRIKEKLPQYKLQFHNLENKLELGNYYLLKEKIKEYNELNNSLTQKTDNHKKLKI